MRLKVADLKRLIKEAVNEAANADMSEEEAASVVDALKTLSKSKSLSKTEKEAFSKVARLVNQYFVPSSKEARDLKYYSRFDPEPEAKAPRSKSTGNQSYYSRFDRGPDDETAAMDALHRKMDRGEL